MPRTVAAPVRIAIVGTGGISGAHAPGYKRLADKLHVVALCDVDPEAMAARSDQLGGVDQRFADWRTMFRELAGRLDAVDLCLPHHLHAPAILDAAAAGLHVFCEKPMCTSTADADAIADAVDRAGVTYMAAHNQMFMPAVLEARRRIDAGDLGRVMYLRSQDCFNAGPRTRAQWKWRADAQTQGGGELIDTGYHPAYRLLYLAASPAVAVRATMGRFLQEIDGEDAAALSVRFANGSVGELLTSWAFNNPHGSHQIHVIGDKAQLYGSESTLYFLPHGEKTPTEQAFPPTDTFAAELEHFADCLTHGTKPICGVAEGRAVLELILQATDSAAGWADTAAKRV